MEVYSEGSGPGTYRIRSTKSRVGLCKHDCTCLESEPLQKWVLSGYEYYIFLDPCHAGRGSNTPACTIGGRESHCT
jgi:hypothetical protein